MWLAGNKRTRPGAWNACAVDENRTGAANHGGSTICDGSDVDSQAATTEQNMALPKHVGRNALTVVY